MVSPAEREAVRRLLDKAEKLLERAWSGLLVAISLIVGGLYDTTIGLAGLCVLVGSVLTWAWGSRFIRAANRILNAPYQQ